MSKAGLAGIQSGKWIASLIGVLAMIASKVFIIKKLPNGSFLFSRFLDYYMSFYKLCKLINVANIRY